MSVSSKAARWCRVCGNRIVPKATGRPAKYCSASCRQSAYWARKFGVEQ